MHYLDICAKIKERRTLLGITQQEAADISGVSVRTIKNMETGKGNPSIHTLSSILDVMGMELEAKIKRTVE